MRHVLKIAGLAALVAFGAGIQAEPASAQFDIRIGSDRPRVIERREYGGPRVIERHSYRPARRVCRTEIRVHRRPNGVVVRRPVEVCTTRGGPRW